MSSRPDGLLATEEYIITGVVDGDSFTSKLSKPLVASVSLADVTGGTAQASASISSRVITIDTYGSTGAGTAYVTVKGRK